MRMSPKFTGVAKILLAAGMMFSSGGQLLAQCANPTQLPGQVIATGPALTFVDNYALATSNFIVNGGGSVTFIAGACIDLGMGFDANSSGGTVATTFDAWVDPTPSAVSALPASGAGLSQQFTWTASSPAGYAHLGHIFAILGPSVSGQNECYIHYYQPSNVLSLFDDSSGTWLGMAAPGTPNTVVGNQRCTIDIGNSSVTSSGNQLTLTVPVTFLPAFAGMQTNYLIAYDNAGLNSYWQPMGTWTVGFNQTITSSPPGLSLTVDGVACTSPCVIPWPVGSSHTIAAATQPAGAGMQYAFANWSDGGAASHTVTPSTTTTYTANFTAQFYLTTSAGAGGSISPASGWYNAGGTAVVSASASPGYQLAGFSGALGGTSTPQNLTMNTPLTVVAVFLVLPPSLTITSSHTDPFTQGQANATYTLTVANGANAGPTGGAVTVAESVPPGLIPVSMTGSGWTCTVTSCTRSDALSTGASYPAITLTVNVALNAPASVTNTATVTGGGSLSATASDPTNITALPRYSNPLAFAVPASVVGGAPVTFSVTYASSAGASDIASGAIQIDGCSLEWDTSGNVSLGPLTSGVLGQQFTLSNSSCAINLASSSLSPVAGNPDALSLSLNIAFSEQNFVGTHEVYAWGTNAANLTTAQTDLGALVVSQGPDFILNVTPSGIIFVPYLGTATINVTATALNGFNDEISLSLSQLNPNCFSLTGDLPSLTPNSQGQFTFQNHCQGYNPNTDQFQITGSAASIGVSHTVYNGPTLAPEPGSGFTVTVGLPSSPALPVQGSISYPINMTSIGGLAGTVTLTLAPAPGNAMPAGVTYQFSPSSVYLPGVGTAASTLTFTASGAALGGTFPLVITGSMPNNPAQTANFALGTQVTTFQVSSATGSGIVHNTGQEVQVTHTVPAGSVPANATCATADPEVTCRVISSSSGAVTLGITATTSAALGTRDVSLGGGAATAHAEVGSYFGGGCDALEAPVGGAARCTLQGWDSSCIENGTCSQPNVSGPASEWISVTDIEGGGASLLFAPTSDATPGQYTYNIDFGASCFLNDSLFPCEEETGEATVDGATLSAPDVTGIYPSTITAGTTGVIIINGYYFTGATISINGTGLTTTYTVLGDNQINIPYTADPNAPGGSRTITIVTAGGQTSVGINVRAIASIKLELVQTVISQDGNYSEDSTIRVTAMDQNNQPLTSFTGTVNIAEDGTSIYSGNSGLPPSVSITSGGTATFVAKSLAGPKTEGQNGAPPDSAKIKATNYPVYQGASLSVPQWITSGAHTDPLATNPTATYDWFQYRMRDIYNNAIAAGGGLTTVMKTVSGYTLNGAIFGGAEADGLPGQMTSSLVFNPFYNFRYRLDSAPSAGYCGLPAPAHLLTYVYYHEARHGYQFSLMTPANDEDGDQLVNNIPIAPSDIFIDTTATRTVCDEAKSTTQQFAFKGKNNPDAYGDVENSIVGVGFAIEMDAHKFASQH